MENRTITLDGISYDVGQFSKELQQAVSVYNVFNSDLQKSQLEVLKTQTAMQALAGQIGEALKKELAEKAAAAAAAASAEEVVESTKAD